MTAFAQVEDRLRKEPATWLVTGAAGFIGSHLVQNLLGLNQQVIGFDNLSTGFHRNLDDVQKSVSAEQWKTFRLIRGDICNFDECAAACNGADYVLHQAALGSVPRSLADPMRSHRNNVDGFLNILLAARDAKVRRFVYASSSSVYGDHPNLPKVEPSIGQPLSPYAATKRINELYAQVVSRCFGISVVGLRYFNVFGPRQDPNGAYAAVIPRWFAAVLCKENIIINGDGNTSLDFCYIANVVQANLLAATGTIESDNQVYNVAVGRRTTLKELAAVIQSLLKERVAGSGSMIEFQPERPGDVKHSLADISSARERLKYAPTHTLEEGLAESCQWYIRNSSNQE